MGFNGKTVWRIQTKKRVETLLSSFQKNSMEHMAPKCNYWIGTWKPGRIKLTNKMKNSVQIGTVGTLQDEN